MNESEKPFTCHGCGVHKTPNGTPQNAPFVWTDAKTKKRRLYCYDCDDKLIQDAPLPVSQRTQEEKR